MAEKSYYWPAPTGDGATEPYSAGLWTDWWRKLYTRQQADEGVLWYFRQRLEVFSFDNGTATVKRGGAFVYGTLYTLDSDTTLVLTAPTTNPRIDVIAVQKDWASQTVRLVVVEGVEAGVPVAPTLTQDVSNLWQMPLAEVLINPDLTTTTTDRRVRAVSPLSVPPTGYPSWELIGEASPFGVDQVTFTWPDYSPPLNPVYHAGIKVIGYVRNQLGSTGVTMADVYLRNDTTVGNYYNTITRKLVGATAVSVIGQAASALPQVPVLDGGNTPNISWFEITLPMPQGETTLRNRVLVIDSGFAYGNSLANNMFFQRSTTFYDVTGNVNQIDIDLNAVTTFGFGSKVTCFALK